MKTEHVLPGNKLDVPFGFELYVENVIVVIRQDKQFNAAHTMVREFPEELESVTIHLKGFRINKQQTLKEALLEAVNRCDPNSGADKRKDGAAGN